MYTIHQPLTGTHILQVPVFNIPADMLEIIKKSMYADLINQLKIVQEVPHYIKKLLLTGDLN